MAASCFSTGDRVRACVSTVYFRAGMLGTVRAVIQPLNILYLVQFDNQSRLEIVSQEALELVKQDHEHSL
jgi:hypothetical protein